MVISPCSECQCRSILLHVSKFSISICIRIAISFIVSLLVTLSNHQNHYDYVHVVAVAVGVAITFYLLQLFYSILNLIKQLFASFLLYSYCDYI